MFNVTALQTFVDVCLGGYKVVFRNRLRRSGVVRKQDPLKYDPSTRAPKTVQQVL